MTASGAEVVEVDATPAVEGTAEVGCKSKYVVSEQRSSPESDQDDFNETFEEDSDDESENGSGEDNCEVAAERASEQSCGSAVANVSCVDFTIDGAHTPTTIVVEKTARSACFHHHESQGVDGSSNLPGSADCPDCAANLAIHDAPGDGAESESGHVEYDEEFDDEEEDGDDLGESEGEDDD